jgi:hypothetical protein
MVICAKPIKNGCLHLVNNIFTYFSPSKLVDFLHHIMVLLLCNMMQCVGSKLKQVHSYRSLSSRSMNVCILVSESIGLRDLNHVDMLLLGNFILLLSSLISIFLAGHMTTLTVAHKRSINWTFYTS